MQVSSKSHSLQAFDGIGESREERIQSLMVINEMHNRYGNIQEVIIQNFKPKRIP